MGMYDDIQSDIKEALLTDLSDAYISFNVTELSSTSYDTDTGLVTNTSQTSSCKGVVLKFSEGVVLDLPESIVTLSILVLDSDKPFDFEKNQKVTYLEKDYKIVGLKTDPITATWTLNCMKWE